MNIDGSQIGSPPKTKVSSSRKRTSDKDSVLRNLAERMKSQQQSTIKKPFTDQASSGITSPNKDRSLNAVDYAITPNAQYM